jgi:ATP/maltotriose-dependent transcriptional regulator MalT
MFPSSGILTGREQQVLTLLNQGRSNKEIANALNIAPATVKNHVHHLLAKLQVTTRSQAMALGGALAKTNLTCQTPRRHAG